MAAERANRLRQARRVFLDRWRIFVCVTNPEAAADIQITQPDSRARQLATISRQARGGAAERRDFRDLRTNVPADSPPINPQRLLVEKIQAARFRPVDSEFVPMMARRDVRMPARFDSRIDANRGGSGAANARGFAGQHFEFGRGFDIEKQNSRAERFANFLARLAHSRKNDALAGHADAPQTKQLARGNNIRVAIAHGQMNEHTLEQLIVGFWNREFDVLVCT